MLLAIGLQCTSFFSFSRLHFSSGNVTPPPVHTAFVPPLDLSRSSYYCSLLCTRQYSIIPTYFYLVQLTKARARVTMHGGYHSRYARGTSFASPYSLWTRKPKKNVTNSFFLLFFPFLPFLLSPPARLSILSPVLPPLPGASYNLYF